MKIQYLMISCLLIVLLALTACGPSSEDFATQTAVVKTQIAAAWTSTPLPTSTPTPVPFDITLNIQDVNGAPIAGALVNFLELGDTDMGSQTSDSAGAISWTNLPGENATFVIQSQGYFETEYETQIDRGENQLMVQLERNPNGMLPNEACAPNENLEYVNDFQDRQAKGWPEIASASQGWSIEENEAGDIMVVVNSDDGVQSTLQNFMVENFVWRSKFYVSEEVQGWVQYIWSFDGAQTQYALGFGYDRFANNPIDKLSPELPDGVLPSVVNKNSDAPQKGVWHYLEISYFNGLNSVWLDGEEWLSYPDPSPLGSGTISIGGGSNPGGTIYFDDFSVCLLNEEFSTLFVQGSTEE